MTGANGFIGTRLCQYLSGKGITVKQSVRRRHNRPVNDDTVIIDLNHQDVDWGTALQDCKSVVHLASRVHMLNDTLNDPLAAFREVNVDGTLNLARQAAANNVEKFIFLSSIGVNGAETFGKPYTHNDVPAPHSPYAISKYEAELALHSISESSGMELIIVRSPAVYGKNAPGNFGLVEKFIKKGIPLPLSSIKNRRSLLALENLVDFIFVCLHHPLVGNKTFLVSDGVDLSTPEIIKIIGALVGERAKLAITPTSLLKLLFFITKRQQAGQSLLGDLQINALETFEFLDWTPPFDPILFLKNYDQNWPSSSNLFF